MKLDNNKIIAIVIGVIAVIAIVIGIIVVGGSEEDSSDNKDNSDDSTKSTPSPTSSSSPTLIPEITLVPTAASVMEEVSTEGLTRVVYQKELFDLEGDTSLSDDSIFYYPSSFVD